MKKSYFLMAAAAAMFAACSETELVNVVNEAEAQKAIGFETFSYKSTRQVSTTNLNDYHINFSVFGWEGSTAIFENTQVSYASSKWDYAPAATKYWNATATYQFFAVAPYNAEVTCTSTGVIGIPAAASATAATENLQKTFGALNTTEKFISDKDWLKAARQNYKMSDGTTVQFTFTHMLSKLAVAITKTGNEEIDVKSVTITDESDNLHNAATFDGSVWTGTAQVAALEGVVGTMTSPSTPYYTMEYLIIPTAASSNSLKFNITYRITGESTDRIVSVPVTGITNFEAGTAYTLTANIGAAPIKFTAVSVTDWATGTAGGATITQ